MHVSSQVCDRHSILPHRNEAAPGGYSGQCQGAPQVAHMQNAGLSDHCDQNTLKDEVETHNLEDILFHVLGPRQQFSNPSCAYGRVVGRVRQRPTVNFTAVYLY